MLQGGLGRRSNLSLPVSGLCGAGDGALHFACQVICQWGQEGWIQANGRKVIDYLSSRNSTSSMCFMGDSSFRFVRLARRNQRREVVRRDYHRVLKGRGRCLDFMICD